MSAMDIVNVLLGLSSIAVTLWVFYAEILRKLNLLLDNKQASLDVKQASDLLELYLRATQKELQLITEDFFRSRLPNLDADEEINRFVYGRYDEVLKGNRLLMANLKIKGGLSFQQFLDANNPRDGEIINAAKGKVHEIYLATAHKTMTGEEARHKVLALMEAAAQRSNDRLIRALNEIYAN